MMQPISARLISEAEGYEVTYATIQGGVAKLSFGTVPAAEIAATETAIRDYLTASATRATPEILAAAELRAKREAMVCSPLQGRLVLGEAICNALDDLVTDPLTPWAMRQTIDKALEWQRLSPTIDELGWLLGFTDLQMDGLFAAAMALDI